MATAGLEFRMTLRNGEQLLLALVIPLLALIGGTLISIVGLPEPRINAVLPGVLVLAVMSSAFTSQAITTGFDRRYGVLKRLAAAGVGRCPADRREVRGDTGRHRRAVRHHRGGCGRPGLAPANRWPATAVSGSVGALGGPDHAARNRGVHRSGAAAGRHPARRGGPGGGQSAVVGFGPWSAGLSCR